MAAYPLGLCGVGWKQGESFGPERASAGDITCGLALFCFGGEGIEPL
jgi:hypothetical protein